MCASDSVCRIAVAKKRKLLAARGMSRLRASESGLPVSIDSARASFSRSRSMRSAMRRRRRERSAAEVFDQVSKALSAAATADSTSRPSLSGTCEYGLPVAGSMLSRNFPPAGSTNLPSMKLRIFVMSSVVGIIMELSQFRENGSRGFGTRAGFAELLDYAVELGNHSPPIVWIIYQPQHGTGNRFRSGFVLEKFRNDLAAGQDVRHPEKRGAHEEARGKISRPGNFVDEDER